MAAYISSIFSNEYGDYIGIQTETLDENFGN